MKTTTDEVTEKLSTVSTISVKNSQTGTIAACSITKNRPETTLAFHGKSDTFQELELEKLTWLLTVMDSTTLTQLPVKVSALTVLAKSKVSLS